MNKKLIILTSLFCTFFFLLTSCDSETKKKYLTSDNFSNGTAGEVLVVIDKPEWSNIQIDTLEYFFHQRQPGLGQDEYMFDILLFNKPDFNDFFQRHRAIVQIDVNAKYATSQLSISNDVWSQPQVHVEIKGNHIDSCIHILYTNEQEILEALYENDLKRIVNFNNSMPEKDIKRIVKGQFNINLSIPTQYFIARSEPNFIWLRYETVRNDRFIIVYKTPMTELTRENCIAARNEITKKYIPGSVEGAYPILEEEMGYPLVKPITIGRFNGLEMRGLWKCENDFMGGPFYSFTFLDASGQNAITVDGFVYAPEENKRDYLREVEAIVKSLR